MDERDAYIALNMMERVGPVTVRNLVEALGSAGAVFDVGAEALRRARGVGPDTAEAIIGQREGVDWRGEVERAGEMGARILTPLDDEYPRPLREIHDPPLALYIQGAMESRDRRAVAIVGTRMPSHYGREWSERLARGLAEAGVTVVSGLAVGIDTAAHRGALGGRGRTIAVIGSGLDRLYPSENEDLARIITRHGCVLSELPLGRQPDKTTFPIRNRIVSGLSMGIVVVEARRKSGAMITVKQALEQGRSVFAVPGRLDSPASQGTNHLIQEGAKLITCVDDILREFEFLIPPGKDGAGGLPKPALSGEESALADLLDEGEQDVDNLIRKSDLSAAQVSSLLIGMEMKKVVRMLPGRMVERVR